MGSLKERMDVTFTMLRVAACLLKKSSRDLGLGFRQRQAQQATGPCTENDSEVLVLGVELTKRGLAQAGSSSFRVPSVSKSSLRRFSATLHRPH